MSGEGLEVLRQAVQVRARRANAATLARNVGINSDLLLGFVEGKLSLPFEKLQALADEVWGGRLTLDPETGLIRGTQKSEPQTLPRIEPVAAPANVPLGPSGPFLPVEPTKAKLPEPVRPGWLRLFT